MLVHWTMLQKFRTRENSEAIYESLVTFTPNMFGAVHMKAFEWHAVPIVFDGDGMQKWTELEYLRFEDTTGSEGQIVLSSNIGALKQLKYASFIQSGLLEIPNAICDLTNLDILEFQYEYLERIPLCIDRPIGQYPIADI